MKIDAFTELNAFQYMYSLFDFIQHWVPSGDSSLKIWSHGRMIRLVPACSSLTFTSYQKFIPSSGYDCTPPENFTMSKFSP